LVIDHRRQILTTRARAPMMVHRCPYLSAKIPVKKRPIISPIQVPLVRPVCQAAGTS